MSGIDVVSLGARECEELERAFRGTHLARPASQMRRHVDDAAAGERVALAARLEGRTVGYGTLRWLPEYAPFAEAGIPEIQDLNVAPSARRHGVASRLLDDLEARAAERSSRVGIGVGLYADYGAAQGLYVQRGYVPDGRGLQARHGPVPAGAMVQVDDDLVLFLIRGLGPVRGS